MRLNRNHMTAAVALITAVGAATFPASVASASAASATTMAPVHGTVQVWVNPGNGGGERSI